MGRVSEDAGLRNGESGHLDGFNSILNCERILSMTFAKVHHTSLTLKDAPLWREG